MHVKGWVVGYNGGFQNSRQNRDEHGVRRKVFILNLVLREKVRSSESSAITDRKSLLVKSSSVPKLEEGININATKDSP
jgi:hypothetical protein